MKNIIHCCPPRFRRHRDAAKKQRLPLLLVTLILALCVQGNHSFSLFVSPVPWATRRCRHSLDVTTTSKLKKTSSLCLYASSSSSSSSSSASSNLKQPQQQKRAGEEGYSLLRQPVQWDLDSDPTFEVPTSLNEDDTSGMRSTSLWLEERQRRQETKQEDLQMVMGGKRHHQQQQQQQEQQQFMAAEDGEDLDLFQRTMDTLDYQMVLAALRAECTTAAAQKIVKEAGFSTVFTTTTTETDVEQKQQQQQHNNEKQGHNNKKDNKSDTKKATTTTTKTTDNDNKKKKNHDSLLAYSSLTATNVTQVHNRYEALKEMQSLLRGEHAHKSYKYRDSTYSLGPPPIYAGMDLDSILEIVDEGKVLEGPEILEVATILESLNETRAWGRALSQQQQRQRQPVKNEQEESSSSSSSSSSLFFSQLPRMTREICVSHELMDLLNDAFEMGTGKLSGTKFPVIGELRAKVKTLKSDIMGMLDDLLAAPSLKSKLALDAGGPLYSEVNGRIVIPVNQKYKNSVGIMHDASRSGKTVYVEPTEIVGPTNELRQAEVELRAEEQKVWRNLTEQILLNREDIEQAVMAVGQLDLVRARLQLGNKLEGVIPDVGSEGVVELKNAKHPVLLLRGLKEVVGSDVSLGADGNQGLVLTGPNAGGKTVILKLLGLVALMARDGIPIPAQEGARVDYFHPVLADIGDMQSVGGDLSTFSGHMLVCREVLASSGENALVLMDELGSGTDPAQGVAIAQAILEALIDTGTRVAITTHYMELKQLAASDDRFAVAGMQFVYGKPTYKLLPGTVGESFALAVAERLNLPKHVIDRATELLDQETRQMGDLIRDLEDQKALVELQVAELEEKKKEVANIELNMKSQQRQLEEKQLSARREEAEKFAKKLEEKEALLENVLDKLKSDPSKKLVARSWNDIKIVKRNAILEAEELPSIVARNKKEQPPRVEMVPFGQMKNRPLVKVGDKVLCCDKASPFYGQEGTIKSVAKRNVELNFGGVTERVKINDLALPIAGQASQAAPRVMSKRARMKKAAEKAMKEDAGQTTGASGSHVSDGSTKNRKFQETIIRTESNTVDVRGCTVDEAKEKVLQFISQASLSDRTFIFILHGHGTGVLKQRLRQWLRQERELVKKSRPADREDGGDAFTLVELQSSAF